jgi:hypothetical protein
MQIAITGASGFIGRALAERLSAEGHSLRLLYRRPEEQRHLPPRATAAFFDARAKLPEGLLEGCEAVVNLAGEPINQRWTPAHKERVVHSRVDGTSALVRAAKEAGVRALISASAIGYYGPHGDEALTEDSPPGSDFLAQVCKAWEAAAAPAQAAGIRTVVVRIGVVLHPEGGALAQLLPIFRLGAGGPLGAGTQYTSWIHRGDLVSLLLHALSSPDLAGPLNATAPHPVTNRELTRALAQAVHRPAFLPVPSFALKVALGEMASMLLSGQRVLPQRTLESGFAFAHPTLPEALRDLLL